MRSQMSFMFGMKRGRKPQREIINTRNILFIVSGAFAGLEKIIGKRTAKASIGFTAEVTTKPNTDALFQQARTQDLIDYGFEPEFIGRLPVRVVCESLTADDLFQIQKNSEGSLIRQYEREFGAYGIRVEFTDESLRAIAERAAEEKTGARGLVTAWESVLRDFKFELPSLGLTELRVDAELINAPAKCLADLIVKFHRQA
jgi:ATP-dependent protease Clp ATPase subunit